MRRTGTAVQLRTIFRASMITTATEIPRFAQHAAQLVELEHEILGFYPTGITTLQYKSSRTPEEGPLTL